MKREKILEVRDLEFSFRTYGGVVKSVRNVSFDIYAGETVGIVGESGSGKSVTAYSLMGLTAYPGRLVGGSLEFNGHQIDQMMDKEMRKDRKSVV